MSRLAKKQPAGRKKEVNSFKIGKENNMRRLKNVTKKHNQNQRGGKFIPDTKYPFSIFEVEAF